MNFLNIAWILFMACFMRILPGNLRLQASEFLNPEILRKDTVRIACVGDIMPGTNFPSAAYLPPGRDCSLLLQHVKDYLLAADITCGNLEGTFAGDAGKPKACKDTTQCFVFRMPDEFSGCLSGSGFDFLSLANNHSNDFGAEGRARTLEVLDKAGIGAAGLSDRPESRIELRDLSIGFCAFSPHPGTPDLRDLRQVRTLIHRLDQECDIVIVSFHGGAEGKDHQHVTRMDETYLGFNRGNVYAFTHCAIDAGADIVFGHGPHVTRAIELYRDRIILYSLGNFCTYGRFNLEGPNGIAPLVTVSVDNTGRFLEGKIIPVEQTGAGGPVIDPSGKVIKRIRYLSETDFPGSPLTIGDDGSISRKDTLCIEVQVGTFLGNEQRNFYGNNAPSRLDLLWKLYLGEGQTLISRKAGLKTWAGAGWTGQPLLVSENGKQFLVLGAYDHRLKKIDAESGKVVWEYGFDDVIKGTGTIWINKNPDHPDNRIVILQGSRMGSGNYLDSPHIPSYRAISYITGKELWRMNSQLTESYSRDVDGSALVISDTAYIGLENGMFIVFDPDHRNAREKSGMLQPGIYSSRKLYTPQDVVLHNYNVVTESSPCRLGQRIYITSGSGHVFGYNLLTREIDWDFFIGSDMDGSPVVTEDNCILVPVEKQYIPGSGGVFKLDPAKDPDNAVVWFFPVEDNDFVSWKGGVIGSVGITDYYFSEANPGLAALIGIDGYLYVLKHKSLQEGERVPGPDSLTWYPLPEVLFRKYIGPSISTPIFVNNRLIAAGYHGIYLFEFNQDLEFNQLDHVNTTFEATPIAWDKKIYIASRDGYLYCLGEAR